jgi:hypothetical protein
MPGGRMASHRESAHPVIAELKGATRPESLCVGRLAPVSYRLPP